MVASRMSSAMATMPETATARCLPFLLHRKLAAGRETCKQEGWNGSGREWVSRNSLIVALVQTCIGSAVRIFAY